MAELGTLFDGADHDLSEYYAAQEDGPAPVVGMVGRPGARSWAEDGAYLRQMAEMLGGRGECWMHGRRFVFRFVGHEGYECL